MNVETKTVELRKITADDGMVVVNKNKMDCGTKEIYLAESEKQEDYIEIPEETQLPELESEETL